MILSMAGIVGGGFALGGTALLLIVALRRRAELLASGCEVDRYAGLAGVTPHLPSDLFEKLDAKPDLTEALDCFLAALIRLPGVDCGGVYLVSEDDRGVELAAHRGLSATYVGHGRCFEAGSPRAKRLMASVTQTQSFVDVMRAENNSDMILEGLRSVIVVPVKCKGRIIASLKMGSHNESSIPTPTVKMAETAAPRIGAIIDRHRGGATDR